MKRSFNYFPAIALLMTLAAMGLAYRAGASGKLPTETPVTPTIKGFGVGLSGHVLDCNGIGLSGQRISLTKLPDSELGTTTTDSTGFYSFGGVPGDLEPGDYRVTWLDAPIGFARASLRISLQAHFTGADFVCGRTPVELLGIEVTQGIQDLQNSVILIGGRPTAVRVHVRTAVGNMSNVRAKVIAPSVEVMSGPKTLIPDPRRQLGTNSFTFSPTRFAIGPADFRVQLFDEAGNKILLQCSNSTPESTSPNQNYGCNTHVNFTSSPPLNVRFVKISFTKDNSDVPTADDVREAVNQIFATFPLKVFGASAASRTLYSPYGRPTTDLQFQKLIGMISEFKQTDNCGSCKYIGLMTKPPANTQVFGQSNAAGGDVASAYVLRGYNFAVAHELGHLEGRLHTVYKNHPGQPTDYIDEQYQPSDGTISEVKDDRGFFGLNILTGIVVPPDTPDLMSYWVQTWPSRYTYEGLFKDLGGTSNPQSQRVVTESDPSLLVSAGQNAILVSGIISLTQNTAELGPVYALVAPDSEPLPLPGDYALRLLGAQGQEIASYSFEPSHLPGASTGSFALLLPSVANMARIVLFHGGQEISSRSASLHAPSITIASPNGGETLSGSSATIQWVGSDADGNQLSYVIQYSKDNGATWETLTTEWTSDTYPLDLSALAGTNQALVRVIASDGFNTAMAQSSSVFTVSKHPPQVNILAPEDDRFYVGSETIILDGYSSDNEDGQLAPASLRWSSNLSGSLGSGNSLTLDASSLAEGSHTISLTATDSDGQTGSKSFKITVYRSQSSVPATISVFPRFLGFESQTGSGQLSSQRVIINNLANGSVNWAANANQSWIRLSSFSGAAPADLSIVADTTGLTVGQYAGQITVTSAEVTNSPQIVDVVLNVVPCSYTLSSSTQSFSAAGGTGSVSVTAAGTCGWSATSSSTWITINSGDSGTSNGTTGYTVAANAGAARAGTLTIGGQTFTITQATGQTIQFNSAAYTLGEGSLSADITLTRGGDTTAGAGVSFATSDGASSQNCNVFNGAASPRCDYISALGTVNFAAGEASKTITILIVDDSYLEGPETFTIGLSNVSGASLGTQSIATVTITDNDIVNGANPLDVPRSFVQLDYYDFLGRLPDTAGWDFWTNQITNCGANAKCVEVARINVSASFFLSIEFQQTGYLVERMYKVAYGDATGTSIIGGAHQLSVPIVRFNEFLPDTQRIGRGVVVLAPGWEQLLEGNKQAYAGEFVQTTRFVTAFPTTMTPTEFINKLNQNTGNLLSATERTTAINLFGGAANTTNTTARGQAVRQVAENNALNAAEFNRAFVLAEYFGYLRRNPNDAPEQTLDYSGFDFWLTKLNQANGNFINAEMVKAFITSTEYRQRFGS